MSIGWDMLWWEDIDELLSTCCAFQGIFGYSGSVEPFTRKDIAKVYNPLFLSPPPQNVYIY